MARKGMWSRWGLVFKDLDRKTSSVPFENSGISNVVDGLCTASVLKWKNEEIEKCDV
jgi:hypothetical protein